MMSVTTSSSAASPELCEPRADDLASRLSALGYHEGDAVSPQDFAFPFFGLSQSLRQCMLVTAQGLKHKVL